MRLDPLDYLARAIFASRPGQGNAANSRQRRCGVIHCQMPQLKLPPPFEDAMKSLERDLMRFLMRSTGDREDSLDLFQETWLRAYRAYTKLRSEDGLRPWVFSIAANLCRWRGAGSLPASLR